VTEGRARLLDQVALRAARAGRILSRLVGLASGNLAAERERWALWAPVALGVGIAAYFALPFEPPLWPAAVALVAALGLVGAARGGPLVVLGLALALVAAGLVAASLRTMQVDAPVIEKRVGPVPVEGRVLHVETLPRGRRVVLDELSVRGLAPEATPVKARVRVASAGDFSCASSRATGSESDPSEAL